MTKSRILLVEKKMKHNIIDLRKLWFFLDYLLSCTNNDITKSYRFNLCRTTIINSFYYNHDLYIKHITSIYYIKHNYVVYFTFLFLFLLKI
jgi:hypothetical protein